MQSGGSPSSVDVYAQTRAEIQTRNTYNSIGATAMKWVPLLNIVLTVVFYALFPIAFPIFLLPRRRRLGAEGLCHRVLLSRGLGPAVRHPPHDPDAEGAVPMSRPSAPPATAA